MPSNVECPTADHEADSERIRSHSPTHDREARVMKISFRRLAAVIAAALMTAFCAGGAVADTIKVAGIYTQPIQQKWDARLHQALSNAEQTGDIEYVFSEKVSNTDYIRVLREYAESGVQLIVGEAFGISHEARQVADDCPEVAFLTGDSFGLHGSCSSTSRPRS